MITKNMYFSIANNMKDYYHILLFAVGIIATLLLISVGVWHLFHLGDYNNSLVGAPTSTPMRNIIPATDNKFEIGTTSLRWLRIYTTNASTTNLNISGLSNCTDALETNSSGTVVCGTDATGAGAGYPFTNTSFGGTLHSASTTLPFYFGQGLLTSSSTIGTLTFGAGTATSTFTITGLTSALLQTDANGLLAEYAGTSCGQFIGSLSALGVATCGTTSYDAWTHPTVTQSATTSLLTFTGGFMSNASSSFGANLHVLGLFNASSSAMIGASTTIQGALNVGGATSTFNEGIKLKSGCYETATSSCLTNTASFTFRIASSTMSTSTRVAQFRVPVDFDITKVSCVTYGASAAIQLDERVATTPQTAGTNILSAALTCTTSGAATQTFSNRFITQEAFVNLQITNAQPGVARPTMLEVHIFGEKVQ